MCGITGYWRPRGLEHDAASTLTAMMDLLEHRGPDGRGQHLDPQRGLAEGWSAAEMEPKEGAALAQAAGAVAAAPLSEIGRAEGPARRATGIAELDRVLGGAGGAAGLVPGSVTLVGGAPGIGKRLAALPTIVV